MKSFCKVSGDIKGLIKKLIIMGFAGIFSLTMSGCYFFPKEEEVLAPPLVEPPKIIYDTIDVKKATIERKITGSATFVSVNQQDYFFKYKGGNLKSINVKLGDKVKKGQLLAELDTDNIQNRIKQQEIEVKKRELEYESKKANGENNYNLEIAKLNLESAKIALQDIQQEYNKAKLFSTIAGQVIYIDKVNAGDYVSAYKTLVRVADPSKLQLHFNTDNTSDFQVGTKVEVKYKDKVYSGDVVMTPSTAPLDISEAMKKTIVVRVNDLPPGIEIGESASVNFILERKENVIVLPRNVVSTYGGRNYVQILSNDMKYERDVEIGIQTPTEDEIVKGLNEGDKVIVR